MIGIWVFDRIRKANHANWLILNLFTPNPKITQAQINGMDGDDWAQVDTIARRHRLGPMLAWLTAQHRPAIALPAEIVTGWDEDWQRSKLRTLMLQRHMLLAHRTLARAGIACMMLKGAGLCAPNGPRTYPQHGLRPMRDLDILVPSERALEAYQLLLDDGASRIALFPGDPAAVLDVGANHLPPIRTADGMVSLELHTHLFHAGPQDSPPDLASDPGFWDRAMIRDMGGQSVCFPATNDLLLHLIVHAAYDHQFNNGPLVISDLAFLTGGQAIDWPGFWQLANRLGRQRGAVLTLRLMEHIWGCQTVDYGDAGCSTEISAELLAAAAEMMVARDPATVEEIYRAQQIGRGQSPLQQLRFALRRLFRSRAEVAAMYPVNPRSARVWLYYPAMWRRLVGTSAAAYRNAMQQPQVRRELKTIETINAWLQGSG